MKIQIVEPQRALATWLCERIKLIPSPNIQCIGQWDTERDELIGVAGYDNWNDQAVEMHVAGAYTGWINREFLIRAFYYPFVTAGRKVAIGKVDSVNETALEFDKRIGFKEVCRIPDGASEGDMVILTMHRTECRWLQHLRNQYAKVA